MDVEFMASEKKGARGTLNSATPREQSEAREGDTVASACLLEPFALESRRYIGSKAKLCDWIFSTLRANAPEARSFCDIFAGTGIVSKSALARYDRVIVNDLLLSNSAIYWAFFGTGDCDGQKLYRIIDDYNRLDKQALPHNWFSESYGDKYFGMNNAKFIGFIREDIAARESSLTPKEYSVLLATLIYSIDRIANTVGHYEAYIKKPIPPRPLVLRPVEWGRYPQVEIFREDANALAERIQADVVYIDPPYNSRQYCRFYHIYETLVKWDKPQLYGVALKPKPENMSAYCTRGALAAFTDLVTKLKARYIAVSYNNTYKSKSQSSANKIRLEDLERVLQRVGKTRRFEQSHQAFNTGKTEFTDHKEILFLTQVGNG